MSVPPRILTCDAEVARGVAWLAAREPALARAAEIAGPVRIRRRAGGFGALFSAIVSQQVSVASADAVWARLCDAALITPGAVSAGGEAALRACGLSRQKIRYALALAGSGLDFETLHGLPDAQMVAELTRVPGIGTWTAEIYGMFSLGRPDLFAAGDLALQEAARSAFGLDARPSEKALRAMAADWSPWRTVAATLLWQYYAALRQREGVRT
ncbi:DNA-3-methyladenine glycosylase 2 family protein [Rhodobacteraceae bacterium 2CG4]|uniref:DNA-3-methyladenine glycosylase II n=1 Tax=Halovulum marinum TaxID=2662447 RepID=A0A6L5YYI2_9RHOB|nr:DNA-3-methyladenine glycosylase [Halovulum marinum]MSU89268.1 DNA-3-methyladenine glycosylase 2 family protein [Halovulum marinum]